MPDAHILMLVPVAYHHNHGVDIFFRAVKLPNPYRPDDVVAARQRALDMVRDSMIEEFGEEEVQRDENIYGGFEALGSIHDGDMTWGDDGEYEIRIAPVGLNPSMSKEELAVLNKNGTVCAACGGPLKGPWPGMMYCPECEG
jgi:hypothetical protein